MKYPRPITTIHQIEVTTFCDLRCVYCPSPKLEQIRGQEKQDMALDTFDRALEHAVHFQEQGTQGELSLTGIGETLLHPELEELLKRARKALPTNFINFSTNGVKLTADLCDMIASYGVGLFISLHRPEKAGKAVELAKSRGVLVSVNASAAIAAFDWAGEVDWFVSADSGACDWLLHGWANVLVDGRVTACCLDSPAKGVFGHVADPLGSWQTRPFSLCNTCHLTPP